VPQKNILWIWLFVKALPVGLAGGAAAFGRTYIQIAVNYRMFKTFIVLCDFFKYLISKVLWFFGFCDFV
jgi:hypothetical protein